MAMLRYAKATVVEPHITASKWNRIRTASRDKKALNVNLIDKASEIFGKPFNPDDYLITHATIVCSVDVENVPNAKLGKVKFEGETINRKWSDWRITKDTEVFANNNLDAWSRALLLSTYKTFVGAQNFCFAPGMQVLMADGTAKAIEEVQLGDYVISHTGQPRKVVHLFEREFEGHLQAIHVDRYKDPLLVTDNHPFLGVHISADAPRIRKKTGVKNALRHYHDQVVRALRNERHVLQNFEATKEWINAGTLCAGSYVLGPQITEGSIEEPLLAELLGYYLSEGCQANANLRRGIVLSFGPHERYLAERAQFLITTLYETAKVTIVPTETTLQVRSYSRGLAERLFDLGGQHSHSKKLSQEVFSWDKRSLLTLLAAWLAGDGDFHKGTLRLRGITVSKNMAQQMFRIAEICGIKASLTLTKVNVDVTRSRVTLTVGGVPRQFDVIPRHHVWSLTIARDFTTDVALHTMRWGTPLYDVSKVRKRAELGYWEDHRIHRINSNERLPYKGKVYNFEVEGDNSYVVGPVHPMLAVHNCEHVQLQELSKGRIIDAVARDIGPSVYVDILIATDRKHTDLIEAISSGKMSTLSMGCQIAFSICSKCGNVAVDNSEMCKHIRYEKGNYFFDEMGVQRRIIELCGHSSDPSSNFFIEASWVETPAFEGAVMRNVLKAKNISPSIVRKAAAVLSTPPLQWLDTNTTKKVASLSGAQVDQLAERIAQRVFKYAAEGPDFSAFDSDGSGDSGDQAPANEQKESPKAPFDDLENDVHQYVVDKVRKNLQKELEDAKSSNSLLDQDDNVGKQAQRHLYASGLRALIASSSSDIDLVDRVAAYNQTMGIQIPVEIYRTAVRVGGSAQYRTAQDFVTACRRSLGRNPTTSEINQLMRLGKLLSNRDSRDS